MWKRMKSGHAPNDWMTIGYHRCWKQYLWLQCHAKQNATISQGSENLYCETRMKLKLNENNKVKNFPHLVCRDILYNSHIIINNYKTTATTTTTIQKSFIVLKHI